MVDRVVKIVIGELEIVATVIFLFQRKMRFNFIVILLLTISHPLKCAIMRYQILES